MSVREHGPVLQVRRSNTILYCERWAATVAFYTALLGEAAVTAERDWFVELAVGDGSFLGVADASRATIAAAHGAGITLSWQVDDVRAERERLIGAGFEPSAVRHRFGAPVVDLHDPDGHRVELWSVN